MKRIAWEWNQWSHPEAWVCGSWLRIYFRRRSALALGDWRWTFEVWFLGLSNTLRWSRS